VPYPSLRGKRKKKKTKAEEREEGKRELPVDVHSLSRWRNRKKTVLPTKGDPEGNKDSAIALSRRREGERKTA